jgi:predicted NAD/FAD-binding protein
LFALGEYFRTRRFAQRLLAGCLAPMGAAIWSRPSHEMRALRTKELLRVFFTLPLVTL